MGVYRGGVRGGGKKGIGEGKEGGGGVKIKSEEVGGIADMKMWAGNIYGLEAAGDGGMIWRYPAAGDGFGAKGAWIAGGKTGDLAGAVNMAIDGSIWVINNGGRVVKYTRGVREDWEMTGVEGEMKGEVRLYTDEKSERLYILDKAAARVVVVGKDGQYVKQLRHEILGRATDLVVDERGGAVYVIDGAKVWKGKMEG